MPVLLRMLQMTVQAVLTARTATTLSLCMNVILLIVVLHQALLPCKFDLRPFANIPNIPQPSVSSQPVIQSTAESLYAMYGEGNFTDYDEHL